MAEHRLQKIIAAAGVTSRRKAELLIVDGRVAVNGEVVGELGATADPEVDLVTLDGRPLRREALRYFVAHKPRGVLCAVSDERGRPVVVDLLAEDVPERLYPAGRLDLDSEGLVLLTNDGDLMQRVTRPGGGIEKVYEVVVGGRPAAARIDELRRGPELEGRQLRPCRVEVLGVSEDEAASSSIASQRGFTRLRVTLHEGKKNQIRRMFRAFGHQVRRLVRVSVGPVRLGRLRPEEYRELSVDECRALRLQAGLGDSRASGQDR